VGQEVQENPIRLVLLDDCALFRASLARFLASEPGLAIAAECATSAEALEVLNGSAADIVLLDFDLGSERGDQFISAARQAGYRGRFLLVAGAAEARSAARVLKLGASGVFLKSEAPKRLVLAIRLVADGEVWVDPKVIQMLADEIIDRCAQAHDQGSAAVLGNREQNVLLGIIGGLTNRKIGDDMGISESSVKNTVQRLLRKAGVKTRSQLVRVALEGTLGTTRHSISRQLTTAPPTGQPKPQ
jgi:DNA-binding NarL/FixJ family response regulator